MTNLMKQRKWQLLAAAAVVGGALYVLTRGDESNNPVAALNFAPVTLGIVEENVTAQGKLEPREYVDVGAQVSGRVEKLHVEIGDTVKAGDIIATIDPRVYEARVQASEARLKTLDAQLAEQQAEIVFARQQFQRNQRLIKADAVSKETLQDSETALKVAEARAKSLKAQIEEAQSTLDGDQTNLSFTKIYAPIDGTVVSQTTKEGQTVNASQTAPVIVQLADLDVMTVRAQVAEADVMRLKEGMDVNFTTLGNMERRWKGNVRQILPTPETINDVVLYNALVDAKNEDRQLMTGMSTQMFFELGRADNVLVIPSSALGKKLPPETCQQGQGYSVRVKQGKEGLEEKDICIGLMSRSDAEVISGLAEGEEVAVPEKPEPVERQRRVRGARL
jgi:macrolide-specific efflux system membrane fusion protein